LRNLAPSLLEEEGEDLVIKHLYIERRLTPLNIYLDTATPETDRPCRARVRQRHQGTGKAPTSSPATCSGKTSGVTRYNRVVFYDYDEIEYMTDTNFRVIPEAPYPEMEMSGEPWYSVGRHDVFPEEFASFPARFPKGALGLPQVPSRAAQRKFLEAHAGTRSAPGISRISSPTPKRLRFCKVFAGAV
jgi:isocitrate dehydrogenase kinase/phosphatase